VVLWEADNKRNTLLPGLSEGLVGIKAGENRLLHLTLPDDFEDEQLRGKALEVTFDAVAVNSRHVPELNDTFAAAASQNEVETLLDLRIKMRQDMEKSAERIGKNKVLDQMLTEIIEQAEVIFHPAALEDYLESMMDDMNAMLKERMGMSLDNFLRLTGQDRATLAEQYTDDATQRLRRDMVTLKVLEAERLSVANDEVSAEIDRMASTYGEQADSWRTLLDTDDMRRDIVMRLLNDKLVERVVAIATGQAPALEDLPALAMSESDSPQ
jgi:trigger factor